MSAIKPILPVIPRGNACDGSEIWVLPRYYTEGAMGTYLTIKGQVTIPADVRAAAGIAAGAELEWAYEPATSRIIATRAGDAKREGSRFARLRGTLNAGMSTDELMAIMRPDDDA
jgi:bifunctional DNA-binding transcriptional regulator/antitoxin component of YhaV-PrlF toxin-antitoxin module